jgi:predicted dehydrogenase
MSQVTSIGIIGVGNISGQYFDQFAKLPSVKVVAVADNDETRAKTVAAERGTQAVSFADLLADPQISIVVNLTVPSAHAEVDLAAIEAGKHVHAEKPLGLSLKEGKAVLAAAAANGVRVGSAPDTFLGVGLQTSLHALQTGQIGTPFAASAYWSSPGHERWHPNPVFMYRKGGGPVLDIGPYYLTALVTHLGPVIRVQAATTRTDRPRRIWTGPLAGTPLSVEVPTHASAILEHASGVLSTITLSFEQWVNSNAGLEIYGTSGTLRLSDPNWFSEPTHIWRADGGQEWRTLPPSAGFVDAGRGIGVAEMARSIEVGRPHRASGELGLHVLEIMTAMEDSQPGDGPTQLTTTVTPPSLVPYAADVAAE